MRSLETILNAMLLAFGLFAAFEASKLQTPAGSLTQDVLGPGFFPFGLGVAVALLAAIGLLEAWLGPRHSAPLLQPGSWRAVLTLVVATVAYVAGVSIVGFVTATFLFVVGTLLALRQPGGVSLLTAAVVTGALYLVFARWLQVPLPAGPLGF